MEIFFCLQSSENEIHGIFLWQVKRKIPIYVNVAICVWYFTILSFIFFVIEHPGFKRWYFESWNGSCPVYFGEIHNDAVDNI